MFRLNGKMKGILYKSSQCDQLSGLDCSNVYLLLLVDIQTLFILMLGILLLVGLNYNERKIIIKCPFLRVYLY